MVMQDVVVLAFVHVVVSWNKAHQCSVYFQYVEEVPLFKMSGVMLLHIPNAGSKDYGCDETVDQC
jgi:hypothetical protein